MKSRRVILTIEAMTNLPLAYLRTVCGISVNEGRDDTNSWVHEDDFVVKQVQANAIRPEPQPRSQRARMAKFAKDDAERADPKRPGWFLYRIAEVQSKPERKAKRAKGAK